jgi:hypothetical protein
MDIQREEMIYLAQSLKEIRKLEQTGKTPLKGKRVRIKEGDLAITTGNGGVLYIYRWGDWEYHGKLPKGGVATVHKPENSEITLPIEHQYRELDLGDAK